MNLPKVAIVAFNNFSPFHFSVPGIVFGDMLRDRRLFDIRICAGESGVLRSPNGLQVDTPHGLEGLADADIIVIPFWRNPNERPDEALLDALRAARGRGALLVGLCLGAYVLAYAGLLDGYRAATHWEFEPDFSRRFPAIHLDDNALYVDDGGLITSAGTAAGLDCCLYILRQKYGSTIANMVARRMVVPPYREGGQAQFIARPVPVSTRDAKMNGLLDFLRNHLDQPHDIDSLARQAGMSRRSFTRHFMKATGMSAGEWLLGERLRFCQELLETTGHSMETIATMTGMPSAASLRAHFRLRFGIAPSDWRKSFCGPRHDAELNG